MGILITILGAVAMVLLGVLASALFEDWFKDLFGKIATRLGLPQRRSRNISGIWHTRYEFTESGQRYQMEQLVLLRHVWNQVSGVTLASKKPITKGHSNAIRATVKSHTFVTGVWDNNLEDDSYHGALQLHIDPSGKKMDGRYIGFDANNEVLSEQWQWRRLTKSVSKQAQDRLVARYATTMSDMRRGKRALPDPSPETDPPSLESPADK
ncbi:MAG: hypothetical protein U0R49_01745 [Fimbriimonadales bacterium]